MSHAVRRFSPNVANPEGSRSAVGALLLCLSAVLMTAGSPPVRPVAATAVLPVEHVVTPEASTDPAGPPDPGTPAPDPGRGSVFQGLKPSPADGPCTGGYEVIDATGSVDCSHGPDPAPARVDVRVPRSTDDLAAAAAATTDPTAAAASTPSIQCYGDGVSGNRVQAVYAHAADVADRSASLAATLVAYAGHVEATFADSAAETGGVRHVRWVTDASCTPVIERVQLSAAGDDSLSNTRSELASLGFNRTDRKYLVWVDSNVYCGIGFITKDDRPTPDNANNSGPGYARVDSGCWGYTTDGNYSVAADGTISVSDAGWNATIGPGQKASFGFGASGQPSLPTSCTFNGAPCSFTGTV